jgi:hypothetical protein
MTAIKSTELLAQETWPLFERKLRRVRFFQKVKKWFLLSASGALLVWILTALLTSQPSAHKLELKKKPAIQVLDRNMPSADKRAKLRSAPAALIPFSAYTPLQRTVLEGLLPRHAIRTLNATTAQPKNLVLTLRADLALACAQLNIQPLTWSLQSNGYSLSALIDQQTLMIMNLMYGTEVLSEYPADFNNESFYRPAFFPADQFVHIAFYEVGDWIQDPLTVRLNMNRVSDKTRIAPWLISSNSVKNFDGSDLVFNAFDRESPNHFIYRGLNSKYYRSTMLQYRKNLFVADRPATAFNPLFFHDADTLIAITAQAQRLTKLSMYGVVYGSKEIIFKSKGIHSLKRLEPILDPLENELYVLAPTNFHFVFFKVDLQTGEAKQVYQTASVWKGAEFEIRNGQLFYLYKGDLQTVVLEPN